MQTTGAARPDLKKLRKAIRAERKRHKTSLEDRLIIRAQ